MRASKGLACHCFSLPSFGLSNTIGLFCRTHKVSLPIAKHWKLIYMYSHLIGSSYHQGNPVFAEVGVKSALLWHADGRTLPCKHAGTTLLSEKVAPGPSFHMVRTALSCAVFFCFLHQAIDL